MNKHPYFNHPYFTSMNNNMNQEVVAVSHPNIDGAVVAVPVMKCSTPIPELPGDPYKFPVEFPAISEHSISGRYVPNVVDPMLSKATWMESDPYLCEVIAERFNPMRRIDGYTVDIDGRIVHKMDTIFNGFICAQAVQSHGNKLIGYPTYIVNTADAGLRQVVFNEDGMRPMDNGPVEDMMIIGNEKRPEGIYVPFCNAKAMADAACYINTELAHYEIDLLNTLNEEVKVLTTDPVVEPHECKCGGACKCGGSCCGNCKCHHE